MTIRGKKATRERGQGGKEIESEKSIPLYYREWKLTGEKSTTTKAVVPLATIYPPHRSHFGLTDALFFTSFGLLAYIKAYIKNKLRPIK